MSRLNRLFQVLLILLITAIVPAKAQLTVNAGITPVDLVESLVGGGVTISNVVMNCPSGAFGSFDGTLSALPMDSGLMLASGTIATAIGPNNMGGAGTDMGGAGDPDLDAIPGVLGTNDACVLEFDIEVLSDTLKFNYIFGSEEYLEFVGSFNDVFAFYISGPGIAGTQNMAIVPGTTTPVSINNVNDVSFPAFYVDNGDGFTAPFSTDPTYLQYDGMTVVMEAKAEVIPCNTYHLKMAIADDLDFIYDSGVFIEAGSLVSTGVTLSQSTSVGFGFTNAIEGCVDGIITFIPDIPPTDSIYIPFTIGGTATNGVDYAAIPDSILLTPGTAGVDIYIVPTVDGLPEPLESVTIYLLDPCFFMPYDSVTLYIQDEVDLTVDAMPDVTICALDSVQLTVVGGLDYVWTPSAFLDNDTIFNPIATPITSTYFTVTTVLGTCTETDSVLIDVSPGPLTDAGPDLDLCDGTSITLGAIGGVNFQWDPPTGLSDPTIANPVANPTTTTTYVLTSEDAAGCAAFDTVTINVRPFPTAVVGPDLVLCPGDTISLNASGGDFYFWDPSTGLDDPTYGNPLLTATADQVFQVVVMDIYGCTDTAFVMIDVDEYPTVDAGSLLIIEIGETIGLNGASDYPVSWTPAETLDNANVLNPNASPEETTWYVLSSVSGGGCISTDSVQVIVVEPPQVIIPNAFTPNGDGLHDFLNPVSYKDISDVSFQIFNRWGQMVFEGKDTNTGWDGTYRGKEQEIGSYIYIFVGIDAKGDEFKLTGSINLLR